VLAHDSREPEMCNTNTQDFADPQTCSWQQREQHAAAGEIGRLADAAKKEGTLNDPQSDLETALRHLSTRAQTTNLKKLAQGLQARIACYAGHTELKEVQ